MNEAYQQLEADFERAGWKIELDKWGIPCEVVHDETGKRIVFYKAADFYVYTNQPPQP